MPVPGWAFDPSPEQKDLLPGELEFLQVHHIEYVSNAPDSVSNASESASLPNRPMEQRELSYDEIMSLQEHQSKSLHQAPKPTYRRNAPTSEGELSFEEAMYLQERELKDVSKNHGFKKLLSPPDAYPDISYEELLSVQKYNTGEASKSHGSKRLLSPPQFYRDLSYEELAYLQHHQGEASYSPGPETLPNPLEKKPQQTRVRELTGVSVEDDSNDEGDCPLEEEYPSHPFRPSQHTWTGFPLPNDHKLRQDSLVSIESKDTSAEGTDIEYVHNNHIDRGTTTFQSGYELSKEPYKGKSEKEIAMKKGVVGLKKARNEKLSRHNRSSTPDNHKSEATIDFTESVQVPNQPVSDLLIRFKFQEDHLRPEPICLPLDIASLFGSSAIEVENIPSSNTRSLNELKCQVPARLGGLSDLVINLKSSTVNPKPSHATNTRLAVVDVSRSTPAQPRTFDASRNRWEISGRAPIKPDTHSLGASPIQPDTVGKRKGKNLFPSVTSHDEEQVGYSWESNSSESGASESGQHIGGSLEEMKAWDNVKFGLDEPFQPEGDYRRSSVVYETADLELVSEKLFDIPPQKRTSIVTIQEVSADFDDEMERTAESVGFDSKQLKEVEATNSNGSPVEARPSTPVLSPLISEFDNMVLGAETANKKAIEAAPSKVIMNGLAYLPTTPMKENLNISPGSSPLRSRGSVRFNLPAHPSTQSSATLTRNSSLECVRGTPVPASLHSPSVNASPINSLLSRLRSRSPVRKSAETSPAAGGLAEAVEPTSSKRPSLESRNSSTHSSIRGLFSRTNSYQARSADEDLVNQVSFISGNIVPVEGEKKTSRRRTSILELFATKSADQKATPLEEDKDKKTPRRRTSILELFATKSAEQKAAQARTGTGKETLELPTPTKSQRGNGSPSIRGSIRMGLKKLIRPKLSSAELSRNGSQDGIGGECHDGIGVVDVDWEALNKLAEEHERL